MAPSRLDPLKLTPLQASERLRVLIENALDCIISIDRQGLIVEFNPAAERLFGHAASDVIGQPLADLIIPPEYRDRHNAGWRNHLDHGTPGAVGKRMDLEAQRADGSRLFCELTLMRQDLDGQPIYTAFLRDITDRKLQETQLRRLNDNLEEQVVARTQELLRTIDRLRQTRDQLERAQEIALVGDSAYYPQTGLRFWSRETFRLHGFPPAEHAPSVKQILGVIHTKDLVARRKQIEAALTSPNPEPSIEYRVTHADGSARWLRVVSRVEPSSENSHDCVVSTIQDITKQKAAEREMLAAIEKERELGQLKSDFLNMISHEYRTPLGIINSSADILRRYYDRLSHDDRIARIDDIKTSARRLADLVEEVLFIGKSDSGSVALNLKSIDYRKLLESVASSVVDQFGFPRDILFEQSDLPPNSVADEQLLRHIFGNAIGNALKYSTLDKPVRIRISSADAFVDVAIRDEGIGIPVADQNKLFTMFHRAGNVGAISGTGLGLVILKRCVDLLGGQVRLQSEVGRGTELTIRIPCQPPTIAPNNA